MVIISRVKEATAEFIKILRFGKNDVQTSDQFLPFGIDSKPVKDSVAIQSKTANRDETVILGYRIESDKTQPGETRIYGTDSEGTEVFYIHLKNDGQCEFNGTGDFFVRFSPLKTGFDELKESYNDAVEKINAIIQTLKTWTPVANDGGAALKVASQSLQNATANNSSIDDSKIDEIETT